MVPPGSKEKGFTLTELLVSVGVLFVLVLLLEFLFPVISTPLQKTSSVSYVNCLRQIHIATMSMANDGVENKDPGLGWPGDLKANGRIKTLGDFVYLLVKNDYLKAGDLKVFAAKGTNVYQGDFKNGTLIPAFDEKYSGAKVYLVKDADISQT